MAKIETYSLCRDTPSKSQVGDYRFSRLGWKTQQNFWFEAAPVDPDVMVVTSRGTEAQHKRRFWDYFWPKSSCAVKIINSEEGKPESPLLAVPLSDPRESRYANQVNIGQVVGRRESLPSDWRNKYSQTQWRDKLENDHRSSWEITTHIGDAPSTRGYSTSGTDCRLEGLLRDKYREIDFRPGDGINVRTGEYYRFGRKVEQPSMLTSVLRTVKSWGSAWLNHWLHRGSDLTASSDTSPSLAKMEKVSRNGLPPSDPSEEVPEGGTGLYVVEEDPDGLFDTREDPTDDEDSDHGMEGGGVEPV